ncbi:hypothetical protein [Pseudogemmobacter humi]|uniref:Uncharacterized protein n=1 Tax=Pseudogemmobacter humi TaxID=2483812 RepID=A0A3P5XIQ2_9RHOB|nr:hypothetical protein [Pseudogemmobacter humi]VDC28611.1 hypothetical protein XINFAN_02180 [Pseudogemmobacter humi]
MASANLAELIAGITPENMHGTVDFSHPVGLELVYEEMIPVADNLYDQHIEALKAEGLI